jgi:hypothetical protein
MVGIGSELVLHDVDGKVVQQRGTDGYINATQLCQAAGKLFADYKRLESTKEFLNELSSIVGIPTMELVQAKTGNAVQGGGTWVHPDVAVNLAQWLSARFAVLVSKWVRELLTKGVVAINSDDPIVQSCLQIAEVRMKQVALEKEQAETRRMAEEAARDAKAALNVVEHGHGHYSVLAYCSINGIKITVQEASVHGKKLTARFRERFGGEPSQVPDPRFVVRLAHAQAD